MEILLFGSTGLLGTHLHREFLRREWEVCAPKRSDISLFNLTQISNFASSWLFHHPDGVIVYAAGYTDITACDKNPGNADHLNTIAPFLLARLCARVNVRFVYFSSDQVFRSDMMTRFYQHHENDPLDGPFKTTQVYGASKADAETFIGRHQQHLIIRTSWLFGDHPTRTNFVRDVVTRAIKGEPIIGLHDYVACPSYAPDVAVATARLLLDPAPEGTYHLVNGPAVSRFVMAQTVLAKAGLTAEVLPAWQESMGPDWIPRNANGGLNNNRGPKLRPWTEGLKEYLKIIQPSLEGLPTR